MANMRYDDNGMRQPAPEPEHAAPRPGPLTVLWRAIRRIFRPRSANQRHRA